MRPSTFILVALLLAGCATDDESDFHGLPPESYWVVTQTYTGDDPPCTPRMTTEPALLTFTAPDIITLSTLAGESTMFSTRGEVTVDGNIKFLARFNTVYTGRFEDSEHFSLTSKLLRQLPEYETCAVRVTAHRYPGPRICEVTTEAEEAELAAEVQEIVNASSLPRFGGAFFGERLQLLAYAFAQTAPGAYAQDGTAWTQLTTGDSYMFTTNDGYTHPECRENVGDLDASKGRRANCGRRRRNPPRIG